MKGGKGMKKIKSVHLLAVLLMMIWGMSYLSIKVIVNEVNPILAAFYRFFIASIILFAVLKIKYPEEKVLKEDKIRIALGGIFGVALYFLLENYSVYYTSASNVAVLAATVPVFTLIAQRIIFKEKFKLNKVLGTILSVIGIAIIIMSKGKLSLFSSGTKGDLMAMTAALCWVIYTIVISRLKGTYKSITVTTYQCIWGCIFLSPSVLFIPMHMPSTKVILNLIYLAVFCSCIAYAIYIYCLNKLGASVITTYINIEPVISLISARILLNEKFNHIQILGSVIIIAGVCLVSSNKKIRLRKNKDTEMEESIETE